MVNIIRMLNGKSVSLLVTREQQHITHEINEIAYRVIDLNEMQDCIDHASFGYKYLLFQVNNYGEITRQLMSLSELREKCPWCKY